MDDNKKQDGDATSLPLSPTMAGASGAGPNVHSDRIISNDEDGTVPASDPSPHHVVRLSPAFDEGDDDEFEDVSLFEDDDDDDDPEDRNRRVPGDHLNKRSESCDRISVFTPVRVAVVRRKSHAATIKTNDAIVHVDDDSATLISQLTMPHLDHDTVVDEENGGDNNNSPDWNKKLRLRQLRYARHRRRHARFPGGTGGGPAASASPPWGIFGLFEYLTELGQDLEWADDAVYRHEHGLPHFSYSDFMVGTQQRVGHVPAYFSILLLLVCTYMLVWSLARNDWQFAPMYANPMLGPPAFILVELGALDSAKMVQDHEWYRLLTALVLHAGLIHYVLNALAIWFIVIAVERVHGSWVTGVVFVAAGLGGNLASALFMPNAISVGASGGLFGLLGVCIADIVVNWNLIQLADRVDEESRFPFVGAAIWLTLEIGLSVVIGFTPFIDNFAHLGGLVFGLCAGFLLLHRFGKWTFFGSATTLASSAAARYEFCSLVTRLVAAATILTLYVTLGTLLWQSDGGNGAPVCPACRYISCLPFPPGVSDEHKWWRCDPCDFVQAELVLFDDHSEVDLHCPYTASIVTVGLDVVAPDVRDIKAQLDDLCRLHCSDVKRWL